MPRTVSWEDVMLDQTEDSVVVRLLSAGLNLAADGVVHRYVLINTRRLYYICRKYISICSIFYIIPEVKIHTDREKMKNP